MDTPGNPLLNLGISTVDFLVLTSSDLLLLMRIYFFRFNKTSYLIEEVNFTEPGIPWIDKQTDERTDIQTTEGTHRGTKPDLEIMNSPYSLSTKWRSPNQK
jgi:hypothetical protein